MQLCKLNVGATNQIWCIGEDISESWLLDNPRLSEWSENKMFGPPLRETYDHSWCPVLVKNERRTSLGRSVEVLCARSLEDDFYVHLRDLYAESGQTLQGSFSAVSKPKSAIQYSLESSRRDLHNALLCTAL